MIVSILHRATGNALAVGSILLTWWLLALATGGGMYDSFATIIGSALGRLVLFGLTLAWMQHLASGVRHLILDTGALYDLGRNRMAALLTFAFSLVATLGIWVAAYAVMEGF